MSRGPRQRREHLSVDGRVRRGYFVSQVGATQFALPAALELLRSLREMPDDPEVVMLSATDPANPEGARATTTASYVRCCYTVE